MNKTNLITCITLLFFHAAALTHKESSYTIAGVSSPSCIAAGEQTDLAIANYPDYWHKHCSRR